MTESLTKAITETAADVDGVAEDFEEKYRARIVELLNNKNERNLLMWRNIGVEPYLLSATIQDIDRQNGGQRDDAWRFAVGGLMAAAIYQARIEGPDRKILSVSDAGHRRVLSESKTMTRSQRKAYARTGPKKSEFQAAKDRRKNGTGNTK